MTLLPPIFRVLRVSRVLRDAARADGKTAGRRCARGVFWALLGAAVCVHAAALPDQDRDGIPDRDDRCPAEPGQPPDGCPGASPVPVGPIETRLQPKIFFRARSAEIAAPAQQILDEIAALLRARPEIARVAVVGHTAPDEDAAALGQARADAVRAALIARGIAPARLQALSRGAARPDRPGNAGTGPALDRRVELRVCDNERCTGPSDEPGRRPSSSLGPRKDTPMRARRTVEGRFVGGALGVALIGVALLGAAGRARGESGPCDALSAEISARLGRCGSGPGKPQEPIFRSITEECRDAVRTRQSTWAPAQLVRLAEAPGCPHADAFQALCQLRPPQAEFAGPMRQALTQPGTSPAVTDSVATCVRALLEEPPLLIDTTAADFLRRLPPGSPLVAPLRRELTASLHEQPPRRRLIREEASIHQLLCRPAPAAPELEAACAAAEPWHQPPGPCPAIGALLARRDVRAGQCDPVLGRNVQLPYECRQAVRAGRAPEVQQLASILQSPFASSEECRALGLEVLCALRPDLARPVLTQWRERTHNGGIETTAQCLVALRESQGEAATPFLHDFFFKPYPPEAVLVELLRRTDPRQREALAPLLDAFGESSEHRAHGYRLFCTGLISPANIAKCNAERARVAKVREEEAERKREQLQGSRHDRNVRLGRSLGITAVSVALAGLHIGLSVRYRDDERNLGAFYSYQGVLAGGTLAAGIGVAIVSTRKPISLGTLAAAVIALPAAFLVGGVAGGVAGYKLGESPGNGRVVTGVVSQSLILGTILGLTWRFSK